MVSINWKNELKLFTSLWVKWGSQLGRFVQQYPRSQRTAAFLSLEKKRTKMDTVYRRCSTGNRRWHRREEAMTERLKPSWWGWLEKGLVSDKTTPRFWRTFSLCLGLMLKKIHWTIYSTAGLRCDLWTINSVSFPHILWKRGGKCRVESFWNI